MEVSEKVRQAYYNTAVPKRITLYFPELDITVKSGSFYSDSESPMSLSEALVNSNSIEFVGCISSKFKIKVHDLKEEVKGKKLIATIHTDDTENEPIPLFKGIVDTAPKQGNKRQKAITAYDELYTKGKKQVFEWYNSLPFPVTIKQIRDSFFEYIGLEQVEIVLPNDEIVINKKYAPTTMQALPVAKSICQMNGVFGIINRQGKFEYRILGNIENGLYSDFYPGEDAFPGVSRSALGLGSIKAEEFPYWENLESEDYTVKPVDKITIRQSEDEDGVSYGSGDNNYIIQGNMFTYGLSKETLLQVAANIYPNVQGFSYIPFTSKNSGLPFLECGLDAVTYNEIDWEKTENSGDIVYKQSSFYILNRELTGIQALKDSYSAKGEEYQTEFITDLQTQIDLLKKKKSSEVTKAELEDNYYNKDEINEMFESGGGGGGGFDVKSVATAPAPAATSNNTIYLIEGEIMIV